MRVRIILPELNRLLVLLERDRRVPRGQRHLRETRVRHEEGEIFRQRAAERLLRLVEVTGLDLRDADRVLEVRFRLVEVDELLDLLLAHVLDHAAQLGGSAVVLGHEEERASEVDACLRPVGLLLERLAELHGGTSHLATHVRLPSPVVRIRRRPIHVDFVGEVAIRLLPDPLLQRSVEERVAKEGALEEAVDGHDLLGLHDRALSEVVAHEADGILRPEGGPSRVERLGYRRLQTRGPVEGRFGLLRIVLETGEPVEVVSAPRVGVGPGGERWSLRDLLVLLRLE